MTRYVRNTAVLAKIESSYGVDPVPTGGANALLVSNLTINPLNANNVDRDNVRPYFGASEQLVGTASVECSFDIEIAGSGAAGTAPAWGPLLRGCAFDEDVQITYVAYTPLTDNQESLTLYWYDSGVLHKMIGARGNVQFKLGVGARPVMSFRFLGKYSAITAAANPSVTLTAFVTPYVVTDTNSVDLTLGATYATGAVTGGTAYTSAGIDIDLGNDLNFIPLVGLETVDITDRKASAKFELDLTAAQEVSFMTDVLANTTQEVSFTHGTAAGNIVLFHAASAQLINPSKADRNGRRLIGYDARLVPTTAGNDELVIVAK